MQNWMGLSSFKPESFFCYSVSVLVSYLMKHSSELKEVFLGFSFGIYFRAFLNFFFLFVFFNWGKTEWFLTLLEYVLYYEG